VEVNKVAITRVGKHLTSTDEVVRLLKQIADQNAVLIGLEQQRLEQDKYQSDMLYKLLLK
jgi:hypothetical protein